MGNQSSRCFCAFCKSERRVYSKKHVTLTNVLLSFLASLLLMFIWWQEFNARFFVLFVMALAVAELFIQLRWRMTIACPHCGFDPVLYIRDPKLASHRVNEFFERKKTQSSFFLSSNPLVAVAREQARAKKKKGIYYALKSSQENSSKGSNISKTL